MAEILEGRKFSAKGGPAYDWKCAFCKGSGIQPRSFASRCMACRGKGDVEFDEPVMLCPSCKGKGRIPPSFLLSCIQCRGIGVAKIKEREQDDTFVMGERLGEITERLQWVRKETEAKKRTIEKKLKPIKPFAKEIKKEVKKETLWLKKLGNGLKETWESLWED